jgi:hypothetical protein
MQVGSLERDVALLKSGVENSHASAQVLILFPDPVGDDLHLLFTVHRLL